MNIAIIPARGGSKRIPRKNIKFFFGKPMIAYSIEAAKKSKIFDKIIVSTDDKNVAKIAKKFGASVPFLRPSILADDLTPTAPVISHAIKEISKNETIDIVCCIYPCTPLLSYKNLQKAKVFFEKKKAKFVYSIVEYPHPIQRAMKKMNNGELKLLHPKYEVTRTQDLEKTFHDAGQFYFARAKTWLKNKKIHSNAVGYEIKSWQVVDIDNNDDWKKAELLFSVTKKLDI
tara:strand:- start:4841 stop:5530 length:690 start_codon:yes stop_codon:yes gene_type:complete